MSTGSLQPPPPGFGDEERRRQLAEEIERAEVERKAALLAAAEADARAAQARLDLARASVQAEKPARRTSARVDPLYGVMDESADRLGAVVAPIRVVPARNISRRRGALLNRFVQHRERRSRRVWWIALALVVASLAALALLNATTLVDLSDNALARWVEPHIRAEAGEVLPTMAAPGLLANDAATGVFVSFVATFLNDVRVHTPSSEASALSPESWLTPEYRVRPAEHAEVRDQARTLMEGAMSATALVPSLAEADNAIRAGFADAGVDSEGLTQDALRAFQSVQRLLLDQFETQSVAGQAIADLDGFLRTRQGAITYRLGEYSHRDPAVTRQAVDLEEAVIETTEAARAARTLADNTIRDLGISGS